MGRVLSMGIQYLKMSISSPYYEQMQRCLLPNCMQLMFQFIFGRLLCNEVPNNLNLFLCTRFKALRVMEDKVASIICNSMLNIMYASLTI
jgi:hypothetical protein